MQLQEFVSQIESRQFPLHWPGQWVAGRWLPTKRPSAFKASLNPNNGEKLVEIGIDKETLVHAIDFASQEQAAFSQLDLTKRLEILAKFRQALLDYQNIAELILRIEAGKPQWESAEDVRSSANYLTWAIEHGETLFTNLMQPLAAGPHRGIKVELRPIGVTAAYLPFSTPLTSFIYYFTASVLAGCPLILSSSTHALMISMLFALLAEQQNIPPAALQVVFGNFSSFKQVITDKRVQAILYIGSREHCDSIRIESRLTVPRQIVLQSGGKNAVIVHSSANVEDAVRCITYGALNTSGQRCTSTSRVFVYRSLMPEFSEAITAAFRAIRVGRTDLRDQPIKEQPFMGPLYSETAVDKFLRFQTMANRESSSTLLWGRAVEEGSGGFFVSPSLHYMRSFDNNSAYQGNILFSPDVAIYDYDVLDSAIDQINTTDASFSVSFIGDPAVLEARRGLFLAPNLMLNTPTVEIEATLPLGGRLQSGHHRFHGPGTALYLCYPQVISHDPEAYSMISSWPW